MNDGRRAAEQAQDQNAAKQRAHRPLSPSPGLLRQERLKPATGASMERRRREVKLGPRGWPRRSRRCRCAAASAANPRP
jgi:hypothetical protein